MQVTDYEKSLLEMMKKFGPAISSAKSEQREEALQNLVVLGFATMTRNDQGQMRYALTREGRGYLDNQGV